MLFHFVVLNVCLVAALDKALQLTDKMYLATATAAANTYLFASQLHVVTESTPAVFVVSNTAKSKVQGLFLGVRF